MTEPTRRELRTITRQALNRILSGPGDPVTQDMRDQAAAALAQLDGQAKPDLREPYVYRVNLQPGLWLTVDASHNILLEVRTPDEAELLAAYALGDVAGMINQLEICRDARNAAGYDAEQARLRELGDKQAALRWSESRDGEDAASRAAAATELYAAGLPVHSAQLVLRRAWGHLSATFNAAGTEQLGTVTYNREHGTYHVRVPEAEQARQLRVVEEAGSRWRKRTEVPGGIEFCGDPVRHSAHEYEGGRRYCEGIA